MTDSRRSLPSVARLLERPDVRALLTETPRNLVVAAAREAIASAREGAGIPDNWAEAIRERVDRRTAPSLHPMLNATGVVLHTNIGRAPLAASALAAIAAVARGYSTLELDATTGSRGNRSDHCASLLATITRGEDALVVNNAAGALLLAVNTAAPGKAVVISRGELVEIGGSFRIPDILGSSGAGLREVGTTNRTHLDDYRAALDSGGAGGGGGGGGVGAIVTVHRSNFQQIGFVATPEPRELAELAHCEGIPYVYDVGSGLLVDLSTYGLSGEPLVRDAVAAGADVVVFSGDKLLGGPQAGCLVGRAGLIADCRRNPLARALRADKLTLAGLEATLGLYHDPAVALREIPVLAMLTLGLEDLTRRAEQLREQIQSALGGLSRPEVISGQSAVGGGSFPEAALPTALVAVDPGPIGAPALALRLRLGTPAVLARIQDQHVLFDPRTLSEGELGRVADAVARALRED